MKVDLKTKVISLKTKEPIQKETPVQGITEAIRLHIANYKIKDFDTLKADLAMWQDKLGKTELKDKTVGDFLLEILSTRFKILSVRENFWVTEMGIQCSTKDVLVIEDGSEQEKFLKRIVENNKVIVGQGPQEKEVDAFFPFIVGQLLMALDGKKVEIGEVKEGKIEEVKEENK